MPLNTFFIEKDASSVSKTSWGDFYAVRPVSQAIYIPVDCFAIGKWKQKGVIFLTANGNKIKMTVGDYGKILPIIIKSDTPLSSDDSFKIEIFNKNQ